MAALLRTDPGSTEMDLIKSHWHLYRMLTGLLPENIRLRRGLNLTVIAASTVSAMPLYGFSAPAFLILSLS